MTYHLKELSIRRRDYGPDKGKYFGTIKFCNDSEESFCFNLSPEDNQKFIDLISDKVVETANVLGKNISESIRTKQIQIE